MEKLCSLTMDYITVVSNGPSANLLKDKSLHQAVFVNYGYRHPSFAKCEKPFLVVVDNKVMSGEWGLNIFEAAAIENPRVIVVAAKKF